MPFLNPFVMSVSRCLGAVVIASLPLWAVPARAQAENASPSGAALYVEHHCGACHALAVVGARGVFGPNHDAMGILAQARIADPSYRGSASTAAEYIRESIVSPAAYLVPGYGFSHHRMPAYDLDEDRLAALVAFLLEQEGTTAP